MLAGLLVGFIAGATSALVGIGGGLVMVPAMHYGLGLDWHEATIISLGAIVIQAPLGVWRHAIRGAVDLRLGLIFVATGALGVMVGAWTEPMVPVRIFKAIFVLVLGFAAWRMWKPALEIATISRAFLPLGGFVAGVLAKWLGIGGGLLLVPFMALTGIPVHTAIGTSLIPVLSNAAVGSAIGMRAWDAALWSIVLGFGGLVGAPVGARIAHATSPAKMRRAVAVIMLIAAVIMLIRI